MFLLCSVKVNPDRSQIWSISLFEKSSFSFAAAAPSGSTWFGPGHFFFLLVYLNGTMHINEQAISAVNVPGLAQG